MNTIRDIMSDSTLQRLKNQVRDELNKVRKEMANASKEYHEVSINDAIAYTLEENKKLKAENLELKNLLKVNSKA
jgi:regulator of replication initiation timing